jgi:hypothetical protein
MDRTKKVAPMPEVEKGEGTTDLPLHHPFHTSNSSHQRKQTRESIKKKQHELM